MNEILESHWNTARLFLAKLEAAIGKRKVVAISEPDEDCAEMYPCQHHGHLVVELDDGVVITLKVDSVAVGVICAHYQPGYNGHFAHYAQGYAEWVAATPEGK